MGGKRECVGAVVDAGVGAGVHPGASAGVEGDAGVGGGACRNLSSSISLATSTVICSRCSFAWLSSSGSFTTCGIKRRVIPGGGDGDNAGDIGAGSVYEDREAARRVHRMRVGDAVGSESPGVDTDGRGADVWMPRGGGAEGRGC